MNRQTLKARSNNAANPNQNVCAQAVARALGVADAVRYLHTAEDLHRAARTRYSVRSVKSALKARTVGAARKRMPEVEGSHGFIVVVPGHVLLLDRNGRTVVDTDPRKRDGRRMVMVHALYSK
jgi:hypothetical protein